MDEIRRLPVEVGSLSHYLCGFISTVAATISSMAPPEEWSQ